MRRTLALGVLLVVVSACAGGTPTPNAGELESPGPASPAPPSGSTDPSSSAPPDATPTGGPSPAPGALRPGVTAATVADRVRLRSLPEVSDGSIKYEPVLPLGTNLYVMDGPVAANGYEWFRVVPLTFEVRNPEGGGVTDGWLAAGSKQGDPWVMAAAVDCPPAPTGVEELRLGLGERLACFGGVPITFRARLVLCDCDVDGPAIEPGWFAPSDLVLIDPTASDEPVDAVRATFLALDPDADVPDPLPVGQLVEVTGMFDHPAAAGCQVGGFEAQLEPSLECRFDFAVTSIKPVQ
jgi:hypothetical protein